MGKRIFLLPVLLCVMGAAVWAAAPTTLDDFFLPGSQPGESGNVEHPDKCDNCHGGYDAQVEPAHNWRGSMMAQAARDPLFYACMAIANQDAPDSGDLCIRCHSPDGWLAGRSIPTDGSALNDNDREGVQCDFCHRLVKPTEAGVNPYPDDLDYAAETYQQDQSYLGILGQIPPASANGMYIVDSNNAKRGPYVDAAARHKVFYSPFHRDAALCGTCHDVSNPAFLRTGTEDYSPNEFGAPAPDFDPYTMFPIERTYSEWLMSEYNTPAGVYAPQFGGNKEYVSTCQDCHMRDVTGAGCNKKGAPIRDDLPLHDMTGGNTFIPLLVEQLFPGEVDPVALQKGVERATYMLQQAASLELDVSDGETGYTATVTVTNETGHKLPSGYPEGRRIWLNVKALNSSGSVIYESGAYDFDTAVLTHDADVKIYEIKPGLSPALGAVLGLEDGPSFHFVVNDTIFSDNRIPPRGFTNANYEAIQSPPVKYTYADGQYWDVTEYPIPAEAARVEATLYYQTLSKEYVTFLRDANVTDHWGDTLYNLWAGNGKSAPVAMNSASYDLAPIGAPPVADFSGTPSSGVAPLSVSFTDLSTNSPTSWSWVFGDGGTSTEQNPTHSYAAAGIYTVSLTATSANGSDTHTKTDYITVSEPGGGTVMHVADIAVARVSQKGSRFRAEAIVTVVDQTGAPVSGATVTGDYTGPTVETKSGTTDADGRASISSMPVKSPAGEWCFEVTAVVLEGATYDAGANIVTRACESGTATARRVEHPVPVLFGLAQNYPNPFSGSTQIRFAVPTESRVTLEIYNVKGQRVATLVDGTMSPGVYSRVWNGGDAPSGIYLCVLRAGDQVDKRRMTLLR